VRLNLSHRWLRVGPALLFAMLLLLPACTVGLSVAHFAPARTVAGGQVAVRLVSQQLVSGELLAVEDASLLVLAAGPSPRITRIGLVQIYEATLVQRGTVARRGRFVSVGQNRLLRNVSRYPQGVSPELLENLLQAYHQTTDVAQLPR
jgi:hypothetical protein